MIRYTFRHPNRFSPILDHPEWKNDFLKNGNHSIPIFSRLQEIEAPLVILIHGWTSSSQKMIDRANFIFDEGYHTLMFDFRGHGAAEPSERFTAEIQIMDLKHIINNLQDIIDLKNVSSFSLYGHSFGGFIALGYSRHYKQYSSTTNNESKPGVSLPYAALILESPMTSYNLIMNEENNWLLKLILPLINRKMRRIFREMHPHHPIESIEQLEVPAWGIPNCPILVVHAKEDSRLGRSHYDLIMPHLPTGSEAHLIDELTHNGAQICRKRDDLIIKFLNNKTSKTAK